MRGRAGSAAEGDAPHLVGRDGRTYPVDLPRWRGDDGSPLLVGPGPGIRRELIDTGRRSQWRYRAALAIDVPPVSLGEGATPLVETQVAGLPLLAKCEWFNPTASFKDRGSSLVVSVLRSQGVSRVVEDSSGNGGASLAAYAAAAGMHATVLVPEHTSATKVLQARVFGADVRRIAGTRDDVARAALDDLGGAFYAGHNWHPFFVEGMKLLAYEIWEDLGFDVPDAVLVPAGAGSLVLGCALGFEELRRIGETDRLPRIIAVQPARCSPLAAAYEQGATEVSDGPWEATVAEGASIARPVRAPEVLAAVRATGGMVWAVPEPEILPAVQELAARGLFVEPTAALVAAAVRPLLESGRLVVGEQAVMVLTGSGVKASDDARRSLATLLG